MHLISTGKKKGILWSGLKKNAESTRREVAVTFYSIVLWISTHRGHERSGEHELQLVYPKCPEKSRGEGPGQLEANVSPPPSLIFHHCLGRRAAWHLVTEESSSGWSLELENIHISQKKYLESILSSLSSTGLTPACVKHHWSRSWNFSVFVLALPFFQ